MDRWSCGAYLRGWAAWCAASIASAPSVLGDQPLANGYVRDMGNVDDILAEVFDGQERLTGDEIFRRVTAAGADPDVIDRFRLFPQGEYSPEEAAYTFSELAGPGPGVAAAAAADAEARTGRRSTLGCGGSRRGRGPRPDAAQRRTCATRAG